LRHGVYIDYRGVEPYVLWLCIVVVRHRAKVTIELLTAYRKSYMRNRLVQMNDIDLCLEVV